MTRECSMPSGGRTIVARKKLETRYLVSYTEERLAHLWCGLTKPALPRRETEAEEGEHAQAEQAEGGEEEGFVVVGGLRFFLEHDDLFHFVDAPEALHSVFKRIDEMKKVVVLEKKPQAADYYEPFFLPALSLLGLSVLTLFGLRFTPW